MKHTWYAIPIGIANSGLSTSAPQEAAVMPMEYPGMYVEEL